MFQANTVLLVFIPQNSIFNIPSIHIFQTVKMFNCLIYELINCLKV